MRDNHSNDIAIVFGNSGGIGASLFNQLKIDPAYKEVYGFSRNSNPKIDIFNEDSFKTISNKIKEKNLKIKLLINAVGYLHDSEHKPEKKFEDINLEYIKKSFSVNTIPTALIIKYFVPLMNINENSIIATLSARVGSISDNYLGGWYSYRSSKAALNQLIKTASIELKRRNKNLIIVAIHPGTVSTKLSKPFLGKKSYQTSEEAASKIMDVLRNLNHQDSGYLLDYNKNIIPY